MFLASVNNDCKNNSRTTDTDFSFLNPESERSKFVLALLVLEKPISFIGAFLSCFVFLLRSSGSENKPIPSSTEIIKEVSIGGISTMGTLSYHGDVQTLKCIIFLRQPTFNNGNF
jgi:hypothetical protein